MWGDITILGDPTIADEAAAIGVRFETWQEARRRVSRHREDDLIRDYELRKPAQQVGLMREIPFGWAPGYASDTARELRSGRYDALVSCFFLVGSPIAAQAHGLGAAVDRAGG